MSNKAKAFPYPYLSPYSSDYLDVDFDLEIDSNPKVSDENELKLNYEIALDKNAYLVDRILEKSIALVFDLRSPATFYSALIPVENFQGEIDLDGSRLMGSVTITARLIAAKDIPDFKPIKINKEFGEGTLFSVEEGDLLGETETHRIPIKLGGSPKDFSPAVVPNHSYEPYKYQIITNKPRLEIHVGSDVQKVIRWLEADNELKRYLWMGIFKDVLFEALKELKEHSPDLKWAIALEYAVSQAGIDIETYAANQLDVLAQMLVADEGVSEVARGIQ